jgi:hypothetical protein
MTVAELIEALGAFPSETQVVKRGFDEAGFDDLDTKYFKIIGLKRDKSFCYEYDLGEEFQALSLEGD